jgi:cell division protein FtsN
MRITSSDNFPVDIAELKRMGDVQAAAIRAQAIAAIAVVVALMSLGAAIFALTRTATPSEAAPVEARESVLDGKLEEMRRRIDQLESDTGSIRQKVDALEDRLHP